MLHVVDSANVFVFCIKDFASGIMQSKGSLPLGLVYFSLELLGWMNVS